MVCNGLLQITEMPKLTTRAKKLASRLKQENKTRTWREISEQDYGGRIHFSVLNRIANTGGAYIPTDKAAQFLLGIYKPRRITPKTIANTEAGQSWTLYIRGLVKSIRTPTPKELIRRKG
jgi:hypothetical protein